MSSRLNNNIVIEIRFVPKSLNSHKVYAYGFRRNAFLVKDSFLLMIKNINSKWYEVGITRT